MYTLCVFDMDGTVVNSIGDIAAAMNRSLSALGYKTYKVREYCHMVGDGMEVLCRRAIPNANESELQELISLYKTDYLKHCCQQSVMYEGIEELIKRLKAHGTKCAILSNKPHEQVMRVSRTLFENKMFDEILGQTERFPIKPAPDSLFYLMNKFDVEKSETAYIGDSNVDIRLGKAAGVFTIGAAWGLRGEDELISEGADAIAHSAHELYSILGIPYHPGL